MPAFTSSFNTLRRLLQSLLTDPAYFWLLASLVIAGDAFLTQLIIRFVPCQNFRIYMLGQ